MEHTSAVSVPIYLAKSFQAKKFARSDAYGLKNNAIYQIAVNNCFPIHLIHKLYKYFIKVKLQFPTITLGSLPASTDQPLFISLVSHFDPIFPSQKV